MGEEFVGALIGALIGGGISLIVSLLTIKYSYHDLYAKTVSSSRNEWINIWRDEISKFLAISDMLRKCDMKPAIANDNNSVKNNNDSYFRLLEEYNISKNKILMRLNLNEKKHQEVYLLINKIDYKNILKDEDYYIAKECLMTITRDLLKEEWERVKLEARGKKYGKK